MNGGERSNASESWLFQLEAPAAAQVKRICGSRGGQDIRERGAVICRPSLSLVKLEPHLLSYGLGFPGQAAAGLFDPGFTRVSGVNMSWKEVWAGVYKREADRPSPIVGTFGPWTRTL